VPKGSPAEKETGKAIAFLKFVHGNPIFRLKWERMTDLE
jgi:hypothetical protein